MMPRPVPSSTRFPPPARAGRPLRITVTAVDASGNIGRASVDIDSYNVDHKFSDINDYWAATYVDFLYNANITTGYNDGTFRPNQNISRAQFAVMLYRYLKLDESKYADVSRPSRIWTSSRNTPFPQSRHFIPKALSPAQRKTAACISIPTTL